ncbi:hypothetical protein Hanom_Chr02g00109141 [Helianthus anomalus]
MFAAIFPYRTVFFGKRGVQKVSQNASHRWFRREWNIDHVVELQIHIKRFIIYGEIGPV